MGYLYDNVTSGYNTTPIRNTGALDTWSPFSALPPDFVPDNTNSDAIADMNTEAMKDTFLASANTRIGNIDNNIDSANSAYLDATAKQTALAAQINNSTAYINTLIQGLE